MEEPVDITPDRNLYALLHVSPDATDEEIRKAYRNWAQIYHPDKYQAPHMKETATQNFQRICEAYEILSDENKRQIYDIYGMEGLKSGLELGTRLSKVEEIKEELEKLRRMREQEKFAGHVRPTGLILASLSLPQFFDGDGIMKGMQMSSEVQSQISKKNTVAIGGNLAVVGKSGQGTATSVFRHQISPVSSIEMMGSAGLHSLIGVQSTRKITHHSTATMGLAMSLTDGSINLSNVWTREVSETTNGNIQLVLGSESSIAVGWQKNDEKFHASGELKLGISSFGASAQCTHRFSTNSHGRFVGRVGSNALELEIGGGRKISNFSKVRMLYSIGIQGIFWKFELNRGGQRLIVPILLSRSLNPALAAGAFVIPTSLYFLLERYVLGPYNLRREMQKAEEKMEKVSAQVRESKASAEKAQQLLQNVADRKKSKQMENNGLVITNAVYGNRKDLKERDDAENLGADLFDVTVPLCFLVNDSGQLKLHQGVKKSGIMGFCDPCPGEPKALLVEYTYHGHEHKVVIGDYDELLIPQEAHRI
ncbi:hypothetical protein Droror1_Dr00008575 [Drosera rotundifolia]